MITEQYPDIFREISSGKSIVKLLDEERKKSKEAYQQGYLAGIKKMKDALQNYDCGECSGSI